MEENKEKAKKKSKWKRTREELKVIGVHRVEFSTINNSLLGDYCTICILFDENNTALSKGISLLSPFENNSPRRGKNKALQRAAKALKNKKNDDPIVFFRDFKKNEYKKRKIKNRKEDNTFNEELNRMNKLYGKYIICKENMEEKKSVLCWIHREFPKILVNNFCSFKSEYFGCNS